MARAGFLCPVGVEICFLWPESREVQDGCMGIVVSPRSRDASTTVHDLTPVASFSVLLSRAIRGRPPSAWRTTPQPWPTSVSRSALGLTWRHIPRKVCWKSEPADVAHAVDLVAPALAR